WNSFGDATLDSLVGRALDSNLDLELAAARIRQARAQAGESRADFYPQVASSGSVTRSRLSENGRFPVAKPVDNLFSSGFDASGEIDVFGGTRRAAEAADAEVEASIEDRRAVLVTLLGEVARSYVDLRGNQQVAAVIRRNIASARATLELTRTRLRAGLG